jgi:hypothetical protein
VTTPSKEPAEEAARAEASAPSPWRDPSKPNTGYQGQQPSWGPRVHVPPPPASPSRRLPRLVLLVVAAVAAIAVVIVLLILR